VVNDCEPIQDRCEALSLSPSVPGMALSISDDHGVVKKSAQAKFSDPNTVYVFLQVQKNMQGAMTISCQIGFSHQIISNVFLLAKFTKK